MKRRWYGLFMDNRLIINNGKPERMTSERARELNAELSRAKGTDQRWKRLWISLDLDTLQERSMREE